MNSGKFIDEQGKVVLSYSSSDSSITIVPPGFTPEDVIPITDDEHKEHVKKVQVEFEKNQANRRDPLQELDDLKAKIAQLEKANPNKP